MPDTENDLARKISQWLQVHGYSLEMQAAAAFQKAGFGVRLSDLYNDFETHKSREIDVTAVQWSSHEEPVTLKVLWSIECKSSKEKPWVAFVSQSQPERFLPLELMCTQMYRTFLLEALNRESFHSALANLSLLRVAPLCHGITQALSEKEDKPFESLMSATKSSIAALLQIDELNTASFRSTSPKKPPYFCCIAFPVIVVDGRLFQASLGDGGTIEVEEVFSTALYWKCGHPLYSATLVYVITKPRLERFVDLARDTTSVNYVQPETKASLKSNFRTFLWGSRSG